MLTRIFHIRFLKEQSTRLNATAARSHQLLNMLSTTHSARFNVLEM